MRINPSFRQGGFSEDVTCNALRVMESWEALAPYLVYDVRIINETSF